MEESQGEIQNLGFVLEATLPDTSGSAPDFGRARSTKNERRPRPNGHPNHFITPTTAERPSRLCCVVHVFGGLRDKERRGQAMARS